MIKFSKFLEQTQAQISASAKLDNTSYPDTNTSAKYAKSVSKTIQKAIKAQRKNVPEIVF